MPTEATSVYGYMVRSGTVQFRCGTESGTVDVSVGASPRPAPPGLTAWCSLSTESGGLRATLHVKNSMGLPVEILSAHLETNVFLSPAAKVFANGWQSDSVSDLVRISEGLRQPRYVSAKDRACGDYDLVRYGPGRVHSWSYTYFGSGEDFSFAGSLDENTAFTRFDFVTPSRHGPANLTIHSDCDGLVLPPLSRVSGSVETPCRLADVFLVRGGEASCIDAYAALRRKAWREAKGPRPLHRLAGPPALLWDAGPRAAPFDEGELAAVLDPFRVLEVPLDAVILGRQPVSGLRTLFARIRQTGALPGATLSPFLCPKQSETYRERKEYIAQDERGRLVRIGTGRAPKGAHFVLDFYRPACRRHLEMLFHTLIADCGAGILRLEDLHVASLLGGAGRGRTRAQAMQDAVRLIQDLCHCVPFIAAGVPLGAAFDTVDYAAVAPSAPFRPVRPALFDQRLRERATAADAVRTVLSRRHLDGRTFRSDPGVFTLLRSRDRALDAGNHRLFQACTIFGGIVATSDPVGVYSPSMMEQFREAVLHRGSRLFEKRVHELKREPDGSHSVVYDLQGDRRGITIDKA